MKHKIWLMGMAASGFVLLGSGAMAQARTFAEVDANGDGVLSYEELTSSMGRATADNLWSRGGGRPLGPADIVRLQRNNDDDDNNANRATPSPRSSNDNGRGSDDDDNGRGSDDDDNGRASDDDDNGRGSDDNGRGSDDDDNGRASDDDDNGRRGDDNRRGNDDDDNGRDNDDDD